MIVWVGFVVLVLALLALDLGVLHRHDRAPSVRSALGWSAAWIALSFVFNGVVYLLYDGRLGGLEAPGGSDLPGREAALQFLVGYLVEKSLSVDNVFVIAMILTYFGIPAAYQHRVLYWGILGALVLRGALIAAGSALVARFDWMTYVFGGLLLATAVRLLAVRHDTIEPEKNVLLRVFKRFLPVTHELDGHRFFTRGEAGRLMATPLCVALVVVESSDLLFAVDSIPAIFAITSDPFLIFTSNVFAVLGLRSLYFALAAMMDRFRYLKSSLVFLLVFIAVKMLLAHHVEIPIVAALGVIAGILATGVVASLLYGGDGSAADVDDDDRLTAGGRAAGPVRLDVLVDGLDGVAVDDDAAVDVDAEDGRARGESS